MRGERALGEDAVTPDEQALLDADRAAAPAVEAPQVPPETEQPAEATPEIVQDSDEAPAEPASQQPKMVPHQAMHEERRLRQEAEKQRDEERRRSQTLEERMNIILRQMQPQQQPQQPQQQQGQPPEPPIPELNTDPVGHLKGDINSVRREIERRDQILNMLAQAVAGQTQQSQQSQHVQQIAARATAAEREFSAQNPDYQQAFEHLVDSRRRELMANGWDNQAEIDMFMAREATALAENALQRGINPAAVVMDLAKIRGWQPKAPENAPEAAAVQNGQAGQSAAEQVQTIARGQQQARGINTLPSQAAAPVNANAVANMTDDEFAAWVRKASPAEKRRVMGA